MFQVYPEYRDRAITSVFGRVIFRQLIKYIYGLNQLKLWEVHHWGNVHLFRVSFIAILRWDFLSRENEAFTIKCNFVIKCVKVDF